MIVEVKWLLMVIAHIGMSAEGRWKALHPIPATRAVFIRGWGDGAFRINRGSHEGRITISRIKVK